MQIKTHYFLAIRVGNCARFNALAMPPRDPCYTIECAKRSYISVVDLNKRLGDFVQLHNNQRIEI